MGAETSDRNPEVGMSGAQGKVPLEKQALDLAREA